MRRYSSGYDILFFTAILATLVSLVRPIFSSCRITGSLTWTIFYYSGVVRQGESGRALTAWPLLQPADL